MAGGAQSARICYVRIDRQKNLDITMSGFRSGRPVPVTGSSNVTQFVAASYAYSKQRDECQLVFGVQFVDGGGEHSALRVREPPHGSLHAANVCW